MALQPICFAKPRESSFRVESISRKPYDAWKNKPKKLAQKDRDARWTVKYTKAKPREDGSLPSVDLAIPAFGYKKIMSRSTAPSA